MARYGFKIDDKEQMLIFILYVMKHVLDPVTLDEMGEMVLIDDNMNWFLYADCVAELVDSGLLLKEPGKSGPVYTLSPHGYNNLIQMQRKVSYSLRKAADETVPEVISRLRREARIQTEVVTRGEDPIARLTLTDGREPILRIELVTMSRQRAYKMCATFKNSAEAVFDGLLELLLPENEEK